MAQDKKSKVRELAWNAVTLTSKGVTMAVKEVQGIAFAFTIDYKLMTLCDSADGFYTASEMIASLKHYGNYSDFQDSRIIAVLVSNELETVPLEDVERAVKSAAQRVKFTPKAQEVANAADWDAIFEELKPYIEGIQSLNEVKNVQM